MKSVLGNLHALVFLAVLHSVSAVSGEGDPTPTPSPSPTPASRLTRIKRLIHTSAPSKFVLHDQSDLVHVDSPEYERVNPIALFIINPKLRTHAAKTGGITVSYNTSNIWSPTVYVMPKSKLAYSGVDEYFDPRYPVDQSESLSEVIFVNPDGASPVDDLNQQDALKFSNMSASDFEKFAKVMHADGVIRNLDLKYTLPLKGNSEVSGQLALYQLVGGKGPLDPSDAFIESFHKNILGDDQPYGRDRFRYNQAQIYFRDANGHEVRFNEGDVDAAFRLDYVKSFDFISRDGKVLTTINLQGTTGTTLTNKARAMNPALQLGGGLNQATTFRVNPRSTATLSTGYQVVLPEAVPLGKSGVDLGLRKYRGQFAALAGYSRTNKKNTRITTYGVGYQYNSVAIDSDYRAKSPILDNPEKLPTTFQGSNQSRNLFSVHNANVQGFIAIEFKRSNITGKIWSAEDLVPTTNGEDIGFGASLIKRF